jgi:DNA-binding regulatory protein, YebC/PmpR family
MPKDNIERAIKKGAGELDGSVFEEIIYEGYGPHNVAIIVEVTTDNRNRSIAFVRSSFRKYNGSLGSANSVQYMFERLGSITVEKSKIDEEELTEFIIEAGAKDINNYNTKEFQIITDHSEFDSVRSYLEDKNVPMLNAGLIWSPQTRIEIDDSKKAEQVIKLIDLLEDDDDVQSVHSNFDISENVLAEIE